MNWGRRKLKIPLTVLQVFQPQATFLDYLFGSVFLSCRFPIFWKSSGHILKLCKRLLVSLFFVLWNQQCRTHRLHSTHLHWALTEQRTWQKISWNTNVVRRDPYEKNDPQRFSEHPRNNNEEKTSTFIKQLSYNLLVSETSISNFNIIQVSFSNHRLAIS